MAWGYFVPFVLVPGALLTAMLASAQPPAMWLAHKALIAPVRLGSFRISFATVMTTFCFVLGVLSFSSLSRAEMRLSSVDAAVQPLLWEQAAKNIYVAGQNMWRYALGFVLWAVAWRLNGLYISSQLVGHTSVRDRPRAAPVKRAMFLAMGLVCLVLADIPLCRLNYNFQLSTFVTPKKDRLLANVGPCQTAMSEGAVGVCAEFCANARALAEDRLWSITWTRSWHKLGALAARIFDDTRGVEQGDGRIDELFARKTCVEVVKSCDKSNAMVNTFCVLAATVALGGFLTGLSNACAGGSSGVSAAAAAGNVPGGVPPGGVARGVEQRRPHGD
eukprot:TRINITY_DN24904_c0_g1_i1.p1 TRINITY_DN24904_c0_g1~~TRINITY_DN24904_c0_g1_i1.p1  ORF type:complete len:360 (+),score=58.18 TRINITY_DN24904_c0_g1_i1:87-1082(+)